MPVSIEEFIDEPIVVFRFEDTLDNATAREANDEALDILSTVGSYYAVLDFRDLPMALGDALRFLKEQRDGKPDMISHPGIHYVVVNRKVLQPGAAKLIGVPEPVVFSRKDDAIDHIRIMIATRAYRMQQDGKDNPEANV